MNGIIEDWKNNEHGRDIKIEKNAINVIIRMKYSSMYG